MKEYNPTDKEQELIKHIYEEFAYMRTQRNNKWKYFNDRTLVDFIDDSELRLTGFVPTKESQGKEDWQANIFHPVTRNKFKAILASVALEVPQTKIIAQNDKSERDVTRAEIIKNMVKYTYDQDNKEEQVFFEAWEAACKGTVIVYDGYLKTREKRRVIKSFDPVTGEIETEEQEIETNNKCTSFIVPLENLYIKDFHVHDIQKQPSLCWVERMSRDDFEIEFGKYSKAKFVPTNVPITQVNETDTFFKELWSERVSEKEPVEVIRYFNKAKDQFVILANGVVLLDAPIILGKKQKWYPFAKTVFEPFAPNFFYGNSLPNLLMGEQDVINALYNMALDKTYKSLVPFLILGNVNKDDFDLEDQNMTSDTKVYVQDINQVREMQFNGVSPSDMQMLELISRGLDLSSVDANQQGVPGRGVTAREVVIANENAKKLKGIVYMFITSLWVQKMKLRIMNILTYYTNPRMSQALDKDGKEIELPIFETMAVDNVELSDGSKGTMGIGIVEDESKLPKQIEVDIEEEMEKKRSGENYEKLVMTSDYLDDWQFDVKVLSESVYQQDSSITQAKIEDKLRIIGTFFPQLMMMNQEKLFKDTLQAYDDDIDEYQTQATPAPPAEGSMATMGQEPQTPQLGGVQPEMGLPPL